MLVKVKKKNKPQNTIRKIGTRTPTPRTPSADNAGVLSDTRFKVGHTLRPNTTRGPASLRSQLVAALRKGGSAGARIFLENNNIDIGDSSNRDLIIAQMMHNSTHGDLDWIKEVWKQTERPLARELDPEGMDPDGSNTVINLTVNAVGANGKSTQIKLER